MDDIPKITLLNTNIKAFAKSNVSVFIQSVQYKTDHY